MASVYVRLFDRDGKSVGTINVTAKKGDTLFKPNQIVSLCNKKYWKNAVEVELDGNISSKPANYEPHFQQPCDSLTYVYQEVGADEFVRVIEDTDATEHLKDVVGFCEANSFETLELWKYWNKAVKWEQEYQGKVYQVGEIIIDGKSFPVNITVFFNKINGKRIAFHDACSLVVDHDMVKDFLKSHAPDNTYMTDAMNFCNILRDRRIEYDVNKLPKDF